MEQLKKKGQSLEAEVKRLTEELAEALKLIKELQGKEETKVGFSCHINTSLVVINVSEWYLSS